MTESKRRERLSSSNFHLLPDFSFKEYRKNSFSNPAQAIQLPSNAFEPFDRIKVLVLA